LKSFFLKTGTEKSSVSWEQKYSKLENKAKDQEEELMKELKVLQDKCSECLSGVLVRFLSIMQHDCLFQWRNPEVIPQVVSVCSPYS
jgi:hypothetical protein